MFKKESLIATSIRKAIKRDETALSTQNVRIIVIDTYKAGAPEVFWEAVLQLQLKTHHISTWKFCQLLHKVLKNGQKLCTYHGVKYCHMLLDIGNYWSTCTGFSYDGYGVCIQKYMKLLVHKLKFHERNPSIPPSFALSKEEMETIVNDNSNTHFQLVVEILDYLEVIISLQEDIFPTHLTYAIGSVKECRYMALTTLLEESKLLYFQLVQFMHYLHLNLTMDTLTGIRDRFYQIFSQLKLFYNNANELNMFDSILWIPKLSETAPTFEATTKSDFKQHNHVPRKLDNNYYRSQSEPQQCSEDFLRRSLSQKDIVTYVNDSSDFSDFSDDETKIIKPSAPPLEMLIEEDREKIIKNLKTRVELLEKQIEAVHLENFELKKQLEVAAKGKPTIMMKRSTQNTASPSDVKLNRNGIINEVNSIENSRQISRNFSDVRSFWANNGKIMQLK